MDSTTARDRRRRSGRAARRPIIRTLSLAGTAFVVALLMAPSVAAASGPATVASGPTTEARVVPPEREDPIIAQEDDGEDHFDEGDDEFGGSGSDEDGDDGDDGEDHVDEGDDDSDSSDDDNDLDDGEDEAGCRNYDDGEDRCLDPSAPAGADAAGPGTGTLAASTQGFDPGLPLVALGVGGAAAGAFALARRRRADG